MSVDNWLAPVQLVESSILGLNLTVNQEFQGDASGVKFTLNTSFEEVEEQDEFFMCRGVIEGVQTVSDSVDADMQLFTVSCSVGIKVGIPKSLIPEETPREELKQLLEANSLSLGYGKVRSIIESITAESVIGRVTIPAINPQAYMELAAAKRAQSEAEEQ